MTNDSSFRVPVVPCVVMFPDITSFIAELDRRKDLARIRDTVSPDLEMAAVANATPARSVVPKRPASMRYVIANLQKSSVAGALALLGMHGQRNAQLHASRYSPEIDHGVLIVCSPFGAGGNVALVAPRNR